MTHCHSKLDRIFILILENENLQKFVYVGDLSW